MKRILVILVLLVSACGKEDSISSASPDTFVHYYNGGNNDVAVQVIQTGDRGLLLLATTEIKASELDTATFKIKLIKTDEFGNVQWQKFYPDFSQDDTITYSYKAGGMTMSNGKIAIAGTFLKNKTQISNLTLITTDTAGNFIKAKAVASTQNVNGQAITTDANGDYIMVSSVADAGVMNNMILTKFPSDLSTVVYSTAVGAGQVTLTNKCFLDNSGQNLFWGGTAVRSATTSIRIVEAVVDNSNPGGLVGDPVLANPVYTETGNDFARYGDGFVFIGQTNYKDPASGDLGTDDDILYKRLRPDGSVSSSQTFPIKGAGSGQNEVGNSICVTNDGGLLLLGTVNSSAGFGRGGKDLYLIKLDAFGVMGWGGQAKIFGSKFDDNGVQVLQAKSGGYIVLGTTTLANLKTILLMKISPDGTIQ